MSALTWFKETEISALDWIQNASGGAWGQVRKARKAKTEAIRKDLIEARRSASNAGWWSDLQDRWTEEELHTHSVD